MSDKISPVRMSSELKELAETLIIYRAFRRKEKAESLSSLVRNLITEGWEREKRIIAQNKEERMR